MKRDGMTSLDWQEARIILGFGGESWPDAFDALDVARVSREPEVRARAIVAALRDAPAAGRWGVREPNLLGHWNADTSADGPASFILWRRGNNLHFLQVSDGVQTQLIARRMHTADEMREFYRDQSPPVCCVRGLSAASSTC